MYINLYNLTKIDFKLTTVTLLIFHLHMKGLKSQSKLKYIGLANNQVYMHVWMHSHAMADLLCNDLIKYQLVHQVCMSHNNLHDIYTFK